jgi:penicillin V acylase-like amidase (Ntn superfamily)
MKKVLLVLMVALLAVLPAADLAACSTFKLQKGSELLYGHNLNNNGSDIPGMIFVNKRGIFKTGRTWSELATRPASDPSTLRWISRYGSLTFNTFGRDLPDGGINEAGLYIWEMGLGGSNVVYPRHPGLPRLNQMQWMQYVLDNVAIIDDAVKAAREIELDGWGWHFFVGDSEGNCAAIDFVDNEVVVHRGAEMPVAGLFNTLYSLEKERSRYFKGYGGLWDFDLKDIRVPRYVKIGQLQRAYDQKQDPVEYALMMLDAIYVNEVADWSVLFDTRRGKAYFRTSWNRAVKSFDYKNLDYSAATPVQVLNIDIQEGGEVGSLFKDYSHELSAAFIASLPIPNGFWEMGGLSKDELVSRLARHTEGAADPARHDFTGTWRAAPAVPGQQPRWQLKISCAQGVVSGTITNAKGFVRDTAIEQISLTGNELRFVFRSAKDGHYMFAKAALADGMMKMNLAGIQDPFGDHELRKESE